MVGTVIWIAWLALSNTHGPAVLFLLSPLVLVPLLLAVLDELRSAAPAKSDASQSRAQALWRAMIWSQLPCALLLPVGLSLEPGAFALLCCLPWAGWTTMSAIEGTRRVLALARGADKLRGLWTGELAIAAGLGFPLVGSIWLLADRLGYELLGFDALFVLLTAVHFHHAGLTLPIISGLLDRDPPGPGPWRAASVLIVLAVPLVALGITFSPLLEVVGSLLTVAPALVVGIGMLLRGRELELVPALLSTLAGAALLGAMCFAGSYAIGEYFAVPFPDISSMIQLHGAVNALGFGLLGAWAWYLAPPGASRELDLDAGEPAEPGAQP